MTISRKITILTAGAAALLLVQGAALLIILFSGLGAARTGQESSSAISDGLDRTVDAVIQVQSTLQAMLRENDVDKLEGIYTHQQEALNTLASLLSRDDLKSEESQKAYSEVTGLVEKTVNAILGGDKALATETLVSETLPAIDRLFAAVDQVRQNKTNEVGQAMAKTRASTDALVSTVIFVLAAALVAFVLFGFILRRAIVKPLNRVTAVLKDISEGEGDLTNRLTETGKDELTTLSRYFNTFIGGLQELIRTVQARTNELGPSSARLAGEMAKATRRLEEITRTLQDVDGDSAAQAAQTGDSAAALERIQSRLESQDRQIEAQAAAVTESSASIEQMLSNIASIVRSIEQLSSKYAGLVGATELGQTVLDGLNTRVSAITEASATLVQTNEDIAQIASQTNLLAMNAAIEAAHAGDAGKGFSVVADEIRKLAENSSVQSKQSSQQLKSIQESITAVVDSSQEAMASFGRILEDVKAVDQLQDQIKRALEEQTSGSQQILEALSEINTVTQAVRTGSKEMTEEGTLLVDRNQQLRHLADEVRSRVQQVAQAAQDMNQSSAAASGEAGDMSRHIDEVAHQVSRFKV